MSNEVQLDGNFSLNIPEIQGDFTVNEQPDINADLIIKVSPEKVSQLENDLNYQTKTQVDEAISEITIDIDEQLNAKADKTTVEEISNSVANIDNTLGTFGDIVTYNASDFATAEQGQLAENALHSGDNVSELVNDAGYVTAAALDDYATTNELTEGLATKQDTISDLSDIRSNASNGDTAYNTIQGYGDIVTYNANYFATSIQGGLADTALQPNDSISELVNDVGYITSASLPTVNNSTITFQKNGTNFDTISLNQANNKTINYAIPTKASDINALPDTITINDLTTTAQQNALNSGATSSNIGQIATNTSDIASINDLIPTQASTSNQLADKNFVNSSVATNTANFIGTFNSVAELEAYSGTLTNNDYAFVETTDAAGNTLFDRYKYTTATNPATWQYEYELNNSSFTAGQWASINSGITANDVSDIGTALQPNDNISELVNDSGYITGITSSDVTNALGYTPYDNSNPDGFITDVKLNNVSVISEGVANIDLTGVENIELFDKYNYLSNASGTRIDTGITPEVDDIEIELKVRCSTGSWYIFQSRATSSGTTYGISGSQSGNTINFQWGGVALQSTITRTSGRHTLIVKATAKNGESSLYVKDEYTGTEDTQTGTYTASNYPTAPFGLWGNYANQTVSVNSNCYYVKMKVGGVLVMDYTPAQRNGVVGFYDTVTNSIKTPTVGTVTIGAKNGEYIATTGFQTVAKTGSYNDLINKPTIPTGLSDITVIAGNNISISGDTISATDTTYNVFTGADSVTGGSSGLVPAPNAGDENKYLSGDGSFEQIDYSQIGNTPTIPAGLSDLTVIAGSNIAINGDTISATDTTYSDFIGADSVTGGSAGLVPAPSAGDEDKFLKANGTWDTISGGGGTSNHAQLTNLDYANSGHTGFQSSDTAVTHTASTSVGSSTKPVYVTSSGVATVCTGIEKTWITPNYNSLSTISSLPWTAPSNCFAFVSAERSGSTSNAGYITVNGYNVIYFKNISGYTAGSATAQLFVKQGDKINVSGGATFSQGKYCSIGR